MEYESNNLERNEDNLSYIKAMEKDLDNNDLPYSYQIPKNDYSDNEDIHFSLLKELEDKWSFIERNKIKITKRKVNNGTNDSGSLKTKSRSRIEDWKVIIEESKKKYQEQKKNNSFNNEDFNSFVKRKNDQLQKLATTNNNNHNHSHNHYHHHIHSSNMNNYHKLMKSFLYKDNSHTINNHQRHKVNLSFNGSNNPAYIQIDPNDLYQTKKKREKNDSKLNEKMKNVYCLITNTDSNGLKQSNDNNKGEINQSMYNPKNNNAVMNEIIANNYTMAKLKTNFDTIISQVCPKKNTNIRQMGINNSVNVHKQTYSNSKDDLQTINPYYSYQRSKEQKKGNMPIKLLKKINESTVILNEMLPIKKIRPTRTYQYPTQGLNYSSIMNNKTNCDMTIINRKERIIHDKNDFKSTEHNLHSINSPKIRRIMNM